ncbi:ubiquitin fusion degradation domain-containing protein [Cyclospora cayetanensis]|uniref:Ubiquitin fusion degradation domain-containing protein n=1 Tax=Cyclospora cayetanensis TaxID=88456 RepID=A0A1D3D9R4_9EIME|nr:ubiquitin fusion degradation domain-containing protein [Cyclospora cayetanensis]
MQQKQREEQQKPGQQLVTSSDTELNPSVVDMKAMSCVDSAVVGEEVDEDDDWVINDFDIWVPPAAIQQQLQQCSSTAKGSNSGKKAAGEITASDESLDDVLIAIPTDGGKVVVLHQRKLQAPLLLSLPASPQHGSICGIARFRKHAVMDLLSGGYDCQLKDWDLLHRKARGCVDTQKLTPDGEEQPALSGCKRQQQRRKLQGQQQIFNPPFVTALEVDAPGDRVFMGLGDGAISMLQYAGRPRSDIVAFCAGVAARSILLVASCASWPAQNLRGMPA